MLALDFGSGVPSRLAAQVTRYGRRLGLSLETLELLATDRRMATDFVRACRRGGGSRFVDTIDLAKLRQAHETRTTFAHRLVATAATTVTII